MPYRLTLATDEERALVVEAMRAAASTRSRAAAKASAATMADKRNGADVRARAVKLVALLAEAADLERLAAELEQADEVPLVVDVTAEDRLSPELERASAALTAVVTAAEAGRTLAEDVAQAEDVPEPFDPSESFDHAYRIAEADRLAELAGLKPALSPNGSLIEDEHGVAPEDVPADDDVVDVDLSGDSDPRYLERAATGTA